MFDNYTKKSYDHMYYTLYSSNEALIKQNAMKVLYCYKCYPLYSGIINFWPRLIQLTRKVHRFENKSQKQNKKNYFLKNNFEIRAMGSLVGKFGIRIP